MERTTLEQTRMLWPLISSLEGPSESSTIPSSTVSTISGVFQGHRFAKRREKFLDVVEEINQHPSEFWQPNINPELFPTINPGLRRILELSSPEIRALDRSEEPVIVAKGALRVTSRFQGVDTESRNKMSDGRISIARVLGLNEDSQQAHLALFELGRTVCLSEGPRCGLCPLQKWCNAAKTELGNAPAALF